MGPKEEVLELFINVFVVSNCREGSRMGSSELMIEDDVKRDSSGNARDVALDLNRCAKPVMISRAQAVRTNVRIAIVDF